MKVITKSIIAMIVLLVTFPVFSQEKMRVAVLDLKANGVSDTVAKTISNMIRTDLVNSRKFIVVERVQMSSILDEQGLQMTGCTDNVCAVKVGKLLSANKIFIGEVNGVAGTLYTTVRIIDVEKGIVEFAAREKFTEDNLESGTAALSQKLVASISGETVETAEFQPVRTKGGYYFRGIIPGWGQVYAGQTIKGIVIGSAFIASAAFFGWTVVNFNSKKDEYEKLGPGLAQREYDSKYDAYEQAGKVAYVALGVMGAVYLYNWIDIILFSQPNLNALNMQGIPMDKNVCVSFNVGYNNWQLNEYRVTCALTHMLK